MIERQEDNETYLSFDLPYPPTVNTYYRNVNGIMKISRKGRDYKKEVVSKLAGIRMIKGYVSILVELTLPDKRKRAIDNILKALLDALSDAGVYEDDSFIVELFARKVYVKEIKGGGAKVSISAVDGLKYGFR